jgi:hypothetical protein
MFIYYKDNPKSILVKGVVYEYMKAKVYMFFFTKCNRATMPLVCKIEFWVPYNTDSLSNILRCFEKIVRKVK